MALTEKEEYELRIKNMQSKIDYLRDQRENLTTYSKKCKPLTDEQIKTLYQNYGIGGLTDYEFARAIEAAHGIR